MIIKKIIVLLLILALVIPFTFSQQDDISSEEIIENIESIMDFSELDKTQLQIALREAGELLSIEQIENNLDYIDDLNLLDETRARTALMNLYEVNVISFGSGASISGGTFHSTTTSDFLSASDMAQRTIEVDEEGHIKIFGNFNEDENLVFDLPSQGIYYISTEKKREVSTYDGKIFSLQGKLNFEGENMYIGGGELTKIDTYFIFSYDKEVEVFLYEERPEIDDYGLLSNSNYFTLDEKGIEMGANSFGHLEVSVDPGNELFLLTRNEYIETDLGQSIQEVPDTSSNIGFTLMNGDSIKVSSREEQGLIPLVEHKSMYEGAGYTGIDTGSMYFEIKKGDLFMGSRFDPIEEEAAINTEAYSWVDSTLSIFGVPYPSRNTMVLYHQKLDIYGNSAPFELDSTEVNNNLLVTSSNRFSIYGEDDSIVVSSNFDLRISNKAEPNMVKSADDLTYKYKDIVFYSGSHTFKYDHNAIQFLDEWLENKPDIGIYIDEIRITNSPGVASSKINDPGVLQYSPYYITSPGLSVLQKERPDRVVNPHKVIWHEFIHGVNNRIEEAEEENGIEPSRRLSSIYNEVGKSLTETASDNEVIKNYLILYGDEDLRRSYRMINAQYRDQPSIMQSLSEEFREEVGIPIYSVYAYPGRSEDYPELPTVFSELDEVDIARYPEMKQLAQLEVDRIYSLDPPAPTWMKEEVTQRYESFTGEKPVPCALYNALCDLNKAGDPKKEDE